MRRDLCVRRLILATGGAAAARSGAGRVRSDALLDEIAFGGRRQTGAETEQGVEGRRGVATAVPAKDERVEMTPEMLAPQAVQGAERPPFEVRDD